MRCAPAKEPCPAPNPAEPCSSSRVRPTVMPPRYAVRAAFGQRQARQNLLLDVTDKVVALSLQLVDPALHDVADTDDRDQTALGGDRDVTEAALRHDQGQVLDAVIRGAGMHIA